MGVSDNMKVFINPGHDCAKDSGAINQNTGDRECDIVRKAGRMLANYLMNAGCEVKLLQDDDLGLVCDESNAFNADVFVSLHCNAYNTQAKGTETWYKTMSGRQLANCIQSQIIRSVDTVDRGVKESDSLWVLNATNAVAVLVELAFIDNNDDLVSLLQNKLDDIVRAIARGITDYGAL